MAMDYQKAKDRHALTQDRLKRAGYASGGVAMDDDDGAPLPSHRTVGSIDDSGDWNIPDSEIARRGAGADQLKNGSFVLPPGSHPRGGVRQTGKTNGGRTK